MSQLTERKRKKQRKNAQMTILIMGSVTIGLLAVIYIAGVVFFSNHFLLKSSLNGIDISVKSAENIADAIADYELDIIGKKADGSEILETITGADVDMKLTNQGKVEELLQTQNRFLWFLPREHSYAETGLVTIDEGKLANAVRQLQMLSPDFYQTPVNAYLSEYISGIGYEIISEDNGNQLETSKTIEAIKNATLSMQPELYLADTDCYVLAEVRSDNGALNQLCGQLNGYVQMEVIYEFQENEEVLDGDIINEWLTVENDEVVLSEEGVAEYIATLRRKYDTIFRSREFETSYGKTVTIDSGDYGWWMNYGEETKVLIDILKSGENVARTPLYFQTAAEYGTKDYGDTYVEINLTAQHLFFYKDGKLFLESDLVSGNISRGNATPSGVYGITYKEMDADLVGEDYETPVSYWMPFNGNVGMHDATWRGEFGSNFYKTSGSHGCVNLPYAIAKEIYENIEKNTAVICYELTGTESSKVTTQSAQEIAQASIDSINAIGEVTRDSEKRIQRARRIYEERTAEEKTYVTNYNVLLEAETKLSELKAKRT